MTPLEQYYRDSYHMLVGSMARRVSSARTGLQAEDIVQESFIKAFRFQHKYDENNGAIGAWFNTILMNTFRDMLRKERAERTVDTDSDEFSEEDLLVKKDDIDEEYARLWLHNRISEVRNPSHRNVLLWFLVHGYTSKEIEEKTEGRVTQSNVTTIVGRFRERVT